jgi:2-hydroxychromene-2-carboxylate isomerase
MVALKEDATTKRCSYHEKGDGGTLFSIITESCSYFNSYLQTVSIENSLRPLRPLLALSSYGKIVPDSRDKFFSAVSREALGGACSTVRKQNSTLLYRQITMSLTIEVFYSFQSPYSYLAIESIYDIDRDYDVELLWQPHSAKASGQQVQASSVNPDKLSYLIEDVQRFADEHSIPFTLPDTWPEVEYDPGRVTRGALVAADMGILMEYNFKVFHRWWGLGENPNDDNFMNELCDELDIDLGEFLSKVSNSDTRERVKGIYRRGRKLGVFDTPTFIIDKERIVGLDKIHYLRERLDKAGLKK